MESGAPIVNLYHNSAPSSADQSLACDIANQLGQDFPAPQDTHPDVRIRWRWLVNAESSTGLVTVENFAFSERMGVRFHMKDIADPRRLKKRVRKEVGEFIERYVRKINPDEDVLVRAISKAPTDTRKLHL